MGVGVDRRWPANEAEVAGDDLEGAQRVERRKSGHLTLVLVDHGAGHERPMPDRAPYQSSARLRIGKASRLLVFGVSPRDQFVRQMPNIIVVLQSTNPGCDMNRRH